MVNPFAIEFFKSKVVFSGTADSKATADALTATILSVLPDLKVVKSDLTFDPKVSLPDLNGLKRSFWKWLFPPTRDLSRYPAVI